MRKFILSCALAIIVGRTPIMAQTGATLELPVPANFSIQYKTGHTLVTVQSPWPGAKKSYTYALYPRGGPKPTGINADRIIATPVRSVVTFSTTYLPALESIGELRALRGVDSTDYVYNPQVRQLIANGVVAQTTKNWMPDVERLISLNPDIIFTYGMGNEWDTHPKMEEAGLPVVFVGEWNEADPLARAEWAIFIAAFFGKEGEAAQKFAATVSEYEKLKNQAKKAVNKPKVLVNGPFNGVWDVSGGQSFMARLLADAGGAYLWADSKGTGGITLSVEAVFSRALTAEVWLNPGFGVTKLAEVRALDPRFSALQVLSKGNVWNNNLRTTPSGGNDYHESAVMKPHDVLSDLIAILHPEILPGHEFHYFRKLGE